MINIFDIKKQKKNLVKNTEEGIQEYKRESIKENEEILKEYKTTEKGLSFREAQKRIEENGENIDYFKGSFCTDGTGCYEFR